MGRWLLLVLLLLALSPAWARVNTDKPLAADEGWLLVVADNQALAESVFLDGPGLLNDDLVDLGEGVSVRLLRAKAGRYRWSQVRGRILALRWNMDRDGTYEFTVKPGVINYPGHFVLISRSLVSGLFFLSNRSLQAMLALDKHFPGVRGRHAWNNAQLQPDPFPEFVADKLAPSQTATLLDSFEAAAEKTRADKPSEEFNRIFDEAFAPPRAFWPTLSPDGKLLAYGERSEKGESVAVVDLASGKSVDVLAADGGIGQLVWASDRALYVGVRTLRLDFFAESQTVSSLALIRLGDTGLDPKKMSWIFLPGPIAVLNPLANDDSRGLLLRKDAYGEAHVYAYDEKRTKYKASDFRPGQRLDKGLEKAFNIFSDEQGELRAALVAGEDGGIALTVRNADGKWERRSPLPENIQLRPVGLSADASHLIVLSDHAREQVEMMKLDLATGALGETLLAVPGVDLVGAVRRSGDGSVIGAQYYRNGSLHTRYLAGDDDVRLGAIGSKFAGSSVVVTDDSRDGRRLVLLVSSETRPGTYYLYDRDQRKVENLFDTWDAFKHLKPVASTSFSVKTADGFSVQGFLAMPATAQGKVPLLVMPHGGPIGVADSQDFDPHVQMLASAGFAVLRVNYRGSGGSGRAFKQAGYGNWGREIEADIDLALEHALASFPLDRGRVALWGGSYGGYSTLMSLIDRPEKYRCGVAVAPVTDLPLMFSSSDWSRYSKVVASMKQIVGDPQTQMAQLREFSPVYQYQRLRRPLLLIHGTEDMRVSYEHAWRLYSLLAVEGRAPELLSLEGSGHYLSQREDQLAVHTASSNFLRRCLQDAAPAAAPAGASP